MTFTYKTLGVSLALFSVLTTAQNSSLSSSPCAEDINEFSGGYNASGSISVPGPRVNDSFPDSTWTWSNYIVDTSSSPGSGKNYIWEQLGLKTSPLQNLSDPSLPYTGCVIALTGIASTGTKKAESDDGTCSSVLTSDCAKELVSAINATASSFSGIGRKINCGDFLGQSNPNSKCYRQWSGAVSTQFLPWNFSAVSAPSGCPNVNPGDSNSTNRAFFAWTQGLVTTESDNFTIYDETIRTPAPIITTYWLKGNATSQVDATGGWAHTNLLCISGNQTTTGSRNITVADKAAGAGRVKHLSIGKLLLVGLSLCLMFL